MPKVLITPSGNNAVAQRYIGPTKLTLQGGKPVIVRIGLGGSGSPGVTTSGQDSQTIAWNVVSSHDIGGHRVVASNNMDQLVYASSDRVETAYKVRGITNSASELGATNHFVAIGEIEEPSWNWNSGYPIWLGLNGMLTQFVPSLPVAKFSLQVGFALTPTKIQVSIGSPIFLE